MSTQTISALVAGMVAAACVPTVPISTFAAELFPRAVTHVRPHRAAPFCGPCGCLRVSYVYHRELRTTYGLSFDPRNFDQTEPYYHFGAVRVYPRYWVDAAPVR
jgi:hypothetical protein